VWHCGVAFQIWVCDYDMLLISSCDLVMSHVMGSGNALENCFADFMILVVHIKNCNLSWSSMDVIVAIQPV
jgi:hypothetical protein